MHWTIAQLKYLLFQASELNWPKKANQPKTVKLAQTMELQKRNKIRGKPQNEAAGSLVRIPVGTDIVKIIAKKNTVAAK